MLLKFGFCKFFMNSVNLVSWRGEGGGKEEASLFYILYEYYKV
jgi:hypothetical protein